MLLGAISGHDKRDSTSADMQVPDFTGGLNGDVKGLKIGLPKEYFIEGLDDQVKEKIIQAAGRLKENGAEIIDVSLPHSKYAVSTYYLIATAEASSNLARYDGVKYGFRPDEKIRDTVRMIEKTRSQGFGKEVKRRIMLGSYVLSAGYYDAYYLQAQKVRTRIAQDFHDAWDKVDAVLTPTTPSAAFAQGEKMDDPIAMYLNDVLTVPASMAGLPAISVPAGLSGDGLPLGLHVIGRPFDEATVFKVGQVIEDAANFTVTPQFLAGDG
jgi:aspartyl-tRNA(Asn)/glutamyl-tRNA(Gln) amidotransferase subunit A